MTISKIQSKLNQDISTDVDDFSLSSVGVHMMFDDVNSESAKNFCEFIIKANYLFPKDQVLTILINSLGGSVYDGFAMIDVMDTSKLAIQTVAIGVVSSMASMIFTGGTLGHRIMSENSFMMIHQFDDSLVGKYHELVATRAHSDDIHDRFIKHYTKNSKMKEKQIKDLFLGSSDAWISSREALKYGLCDKIQSPWT